MLVMNGIYLKHLILSLPIFIASLSLYEGKLLYLQLAFIVIYVMYTLGARKLVGFQDIREVDFKLPKYLKILYGIFLIGLFCLIFYLRYRQLKILNLNLIVFSMASILVFWALVYHLTYYLIGPIFVKEVEYLEGTLVDYKKKYSRHSSGNYIKILGEKEFKVDRIKFSIFRNRVGLKYNYTKYTCIFGLEYLGEIVCVTDGLGEESKWERSLKDKKPGKNFKLMVFILTILILLTISLIFSIFR